MPGSWGVGNGDSKTKLGVDYLDTRVSMYNVTLISLKRSMLTPGLPSRSTHRMRGTVASIAMWVRRKASR